MVVVVVIEVCGVLTGEMTYTIGFGHGSCDVVPSPCSVFFFYFPFTTISTLSSSLLVSWPSPHFVEYTEQSLPIHCQPARSPRSLCLSQSNTRSFADGLKVNALLSLSFNDELYKCSLLLDYLKHEINSVYTLIFLSLSSLAHQVLTFSNLQVLLLQAPVDGLMCLYS